MSVRTLFLQPLDVLLLRGNKLFGDPGSYGESLVPPWPSVAAGAIRSRMLADQGLDWNPARSSRAVDPHPELGTPDAPGPFTIGGFQIARRDAQGRVERIHPVPADIVVSRVNDRIEARQMLPRALSRGLASSFELPRVPVLSESTRGKPEGGYWLCDAGWMAYLEGQAISAEHLVPTEALWRTELRVGVGLEAERRAAEEGKLFSVEAIALGSRGGGHTHDVGFVVEVRDATPPETGLVRFGGDGRACAIAPAETPAPRIDAARIVDAARLRLVLTTPGVFAHGWLPTGADPGHRREDGAIRFDLHGVRGWIVCAAVPRAEVISGFDLARWRPKAAQRVAPTGSVWWLELEPDTEAAALDKLAERGLWTESEYKNEPRRAEGFNRLALGVWS